ncbi:pentatricopeptide repeat-containing protein At5g39710 [Beta vulgaris subsp. vulgaris]|uniref:pentatricopeptide repeat-containing protein At5g39710 n=1 Tax=Beta vulgaris subsp. vulgaris TaxID=3555 RepID=UPI0025499141|nr:pentatricopeptide repeat-containing protein At5g39710 [Beta vulgaris subsp. vulgaris]
MASKALTNHSLSSNSSTSLLTSITKALHSVKPQFLNNTAPKAPKEIPILTQFTPHLNPNLVIQVINNQTNPYHALVFFDWACRPSPNPRKYFHTFHCYNAMFDLLLSHRLFTTATQFLESHNKLCDFLIAKLINAFGVERDVRGAIDWFNRAKMVEKDGNCISSCNTLLGVLVKTCRIRLCRAVFDRVVEEGVIRVDVVTYTTMIRGYCKVGKMEDALKVFDEMRCRPNLVTYGVLLSGFCRKGMMVEARQMVDKMIMKGDCMPDLVTYSTLIDGYCKKGDMEAALMCFDEMVVQGFEPNLIIYNAVVNGYCLIGKVDEAKRMMTKMRLDGVKDDVVTHTSLLRGFCVVGRLDEACQHLRDMISLGIKPDVQSYGLLVNELCKLGKASEAIVLMREMVARGVYPCISSCNAVLKALVERGELNEAVFYLKWIPAIGRAPNFVSYFTVISSLSRSERGVQQVEELMTSMLQDGHKADSSIYSCLTRMYTKNGELEKASRVLCDALRDGCVINLDSFAVFIEGLYARGKMSDAEQHSQELLEKCSVTMLEKYQRILNKLKCKYSDHKA